MILALAAGGRGETLIKMESYVRRAVLHPGEDFKTYDAWSNRDQKDVILKEYTRSSILSCECLLKEAIRQAEEKPHESAVLIDVVLEAVKGNRKSVNVIYVLEKKTHNVDRALIERNDDHNQFQHEAEEYKNKVKLYAQGNKKIHSAFSARFGKDVIIKSLLCGHVTEANDLLREAFMLAYVKHEYNCQLFDICLFMKPGVSVFKIKIIMEKFESDAARDIAVKVKRGERYTEKELLIFLENVTQGFYHTMKLVASTQRIAHRDIKPHNIFVTADRKYKVGDYGSSWRKASCTVTRSATGTPGYMSPEMAGCSADTVDSVDSFLSDIYSLGVTVLQMAIPSVKVPDYNVSDLDAAARMWEEMISETPYSKKFKKMVRKMVEMKPSRRYRLENVMEIVRDMLAAGPPTELQPDLPSPDTAGASPIRQASSQTLIQEKLLRFFTNEVQVFDVSTEQWQPKLPSSSELNVGDYPSYTFISESTAILSAGLGGAEAKVYRLDFAGAKVNVSELPSFPARRAMSGLYSYNNTVLAFGGLNYDLKLTKVDNLEAFGTTKIEDAYRNYQMRTFRFLSLHQIWCANIKEDKVSRNAISLQLPSLQGWVSINGEMSEEKVAANPCRLDSKLYICGLKAVDRFNLQTSEFESHLPLKIPEDFPNRVTCFYEGELIVISSKNTTRFNVNDSSSRTTEHGDLPIFPAATSVVKGNSVFWAQGDSCMIAVLDTPTQFRESR